MRVGRKSKRFECFSKYTMYDEKSQQRRMMRCKSLTRGLGSRVGNSVGKSVGNSVGKEKVGYEVVGTGVVGFGVVGPGIGFRVGCV